MSDLIDFERRRLLGAGAMALASARISLVAPLRSAMPGVLDHATRRGELTSLETAAGWLNSSPLSASDSRGKVVLIDFWTYTCINWLRTLPYVRAWAEKYRTHGLVVVGVHAPEFWFEHDVDNVRRAAKELRVEHPVALDNSFSIWRAFRNQYWPARYLVDARGNIRHRHFGEGAYEASERAIQRALVDAGARGVADQLVSVTGAGIEASADWTSLGSPETYIGYARAERFASSGGMAPEERRVYRAPLTMRLNEWALSGDWTLKGQAAVLNRTTGRLVCAFRARDLHLVLGTATGSGPVRFRVLIDGHAPGDARGGDVDAGGFGTITDQRLYQLIRQPKPIESRQFAIEFLDPGAEAFAFTFG